MTKRRDTANLTFNPSVLPAHAFDTPILQIVAAPPSSSASSGSVHGPWIAVRTSAGTIICSIVSTTNSPGQDYALELIYSISRDSVGGGFEHSDVSFNPRRRSEALIVNRCGEVFLWRAKTTVGNWKRKAQTCELIFPALSTSTSLRSKRDCFWRLAWGNDDSTAFLVSSISLYELDLESNFRSVLYSPGFNLEHRTRHNFTSIVTFNSSETSFPAIYVSTTASVMVFDQRNTSRPVMEWAHHFNSDFTLSLSKSVSEFSYQTTSLILSSQRDRISLNIEFKTSRTEEELDISFSGQTTFLESSLPSSTTPASFPIAIDLRSIKSFEEWSWDSRKSMILVELGNRGEFWARFFEFSKVQEINHEEVDPLILVKKQGLLSEVEQDADKMEDLGRLGEPELRVENFAAIYRAATNGTLFKQPPMTPADLGSKILDQLKIVAMKDRIVDAEVGVSSNIITTSLERARPETELKLLYFSRIEISAPSIRTSLALRYRLNNANQSFKERTAPSISLSSHIQTCFCSSLSSEDLSDDWEDDDDDVDEEEEEEDQQKMGYTGLVKRWEESASKIANRYLPSDTKVDLLNNLSRRRFERIKQAIRNSSDQVALDLLLASQIWLPKEPLEKNALVEEAGEGVNSIRRTPLKGKEWRKDPLLQDPPELHFYYLQPNVDTISKALLEGEGGNSRVLRERVAGKSPAEKIAVKSKSKSRFSSRSPSRSASASANQSGTDQSGGEEELDSDNKIQGEDLGLIEGQANTILGSKSLLSEWELGTDPNDYSYYEPYERIEILKKGLDPDDPASWNHNNVSEGIKRDISRSRSQSQSTNRSSRTPGLSASQPSPVVSTPMSGRKNFPPSIRRDFRTPSSRFGTASPGPGLGSGYSSQQYSGPSSSSSRPQSKYQPDSQSQSQTQSQSQSQPGMASQIVPGRFATRPPSSSKKKNEKKKSNKKRKSGF